MTISDADLTSDFADLTAVPLRELRGALRDEVAIAISKLTTYGTLDLLDEIQEQRT